MSKTEKGEHMITQKNIDQMELSKSQVAILKATYLFGVIHEIKHTSVTHYLIFMEESPPQVICADCFFGLLSNGLISDRKQKTQIVDFPVTVYKVNKLGVQTLSMLGEIEKYQVPDELL